ncbi:MAG: hypothetical protein V6Z82_06765 [Flavobacteriales bacterium]
MAESVNAPIAPSANETPMPPASLVPIDPSQQVTSSKPKTKSPKRVAAGIRTAQRVREKKEQEKSKIQVDPNAAVIGGLFVGVALLFLYTKRDDIVEYFNKNRESSDDNFDFDTPPLRHSSVKKVEPRSDNLNSDVKACEARPKEPPASDSFAHFSNYKRKNLQRPSGCLTSMP